MKLRTYFLSVLLLLCACTGCSKKNISAPIVATTLPVYQFTVSLCDGTGLQVEQLITESVSCLHDYSLQVSQMQMIEDADMLILSGAGLEDFLDEALTEKCLLVDSSAGIPLLSCEHEHEDEHSHHQHSHEQDSHIWLSPENGKIMAANICTALKNTYPTHAKTFEANLEVLTQQLDTLQAYGEEELSDLSCRELITFHDGFGYLAESFHLTILEAMEEESGSEASASELIKLIRMIQEHDLPAVFTETNGSTSAANIISAETGAAVFSLDMAMAGTSYFDSMYHNIDTIKEALG